MRNFKKKWRGTLKRNGEEFWKEMARSFKKKWVSISGFLAWPVTTTELSDGSKINLVFLQCKYLYTNLCISIISYLYKILTQIICLSLSLSLSLFHPISLSNPLYHALPHTLYLSYFMPVSCIVWLYVKYHQQGRYN